ncbi:37566_t:CDS:2, partial [Gigaspora margarita]
MKEEALDCRLETLKKKNANTKIKDHKRIRKTHITQMEREIKINNVTFDDNPAFSAKELKSLLVQIPKKLLELENQELTKSSETIICIEETIETCNYSKKNNTRKTKNEEVKRLLEQVERKNKWSLIVAELIKTGINEIDDIGDLDEKNDELRAML